MQIVSVSTGRLDAPALKYVFSLGRCSFVWQKWGGDRADGSHEIPYVIRW